MKKFLLHTVVFMLPLSLWFAVTYWVDPFHYFHPEDRSINKSAFRLNALLYQTIQYNNLPKPHVILGDSRTNSLPAEEFRNITGKGYSRLNVNSIKLNEIVDLFYWIQSRKSSEHVIIGINFSMFNTYSFNDRIGSVQEVIQNPLKYVYNRSVAQSVYHDMMQKEVELPSLDKEDFWNRIIDKKAYDWYGKFEYPQEIEDQIKAIDEYCIHKEIKLTWIIVPHHRAFQDQIESYGLTSEKRRFDRFLTTLDAEVIDFDYVNDYTLNKDLFKDPLHYKDSLGSIIVHDIFSDEKILGLVR